MLQQFTPQEVLEVMRKISLMSIAVSDKNNQPQSHMLLFAVDPDFTLYFATSNSSAKHNAIKENNKIGISIWSDKEMLIQMLAEATEIEGEDAQEAFNKLAEVAISLPDFWPPLLQIQKSSGYAVFKVKPTSIRALNLASNTITNIGTMFTNIGAQL
ncbi:MAG: hypothetical protein BroJett025_09600 [Patescibacteria group bacterium]|nr:MAG: hypothetical protein BroJett025_09600 [Patescibacteria group bacterium]